MATDPEAQVHGRKTGRTVLPAEAARVEAARLVLVYENHEFDVVAPTASPTSIKTIVDHAVDCTCQRAAGAYALIATTQRLSIRNMDDPTTGGAVIVRLNSATADPITLSAGEYLDWDFVETRDVFFENDSGQAVSVRVALA